MNELPVIGYACLRKELWDRRGANIASRWKEMYGEKCFDAKKHGFGERSTLFRRCFIAHGFWQCLYMENVSFCLNNREISDKIYR